jgi:recombination protein RecA
VSTETTVNPETEYNKLMAQINKSFGVGTIMRLGDKDALKRFRIEVIPTHSLKLNAIVRGGIPKGKITVIFGPEHSGKSALALSVMAEAQKVGGRVALVDPEYSLDPDFATQLGLNLDEMYYVQPKNGEEAMDVCDALISSGLFAVVALDSLAALVPKAELEGTMSDQQMGLQARLIGKALRKISGSIGRTNTAFIAINQLRDTMAMHGPKETMPGGRAPKFWSSVMIEVRKTEWIKNGENIIGHKIRYKTIKNRLAPPQKTAEISIIYGIGLDQVEEIVDVCVAEGILQRAGAWYTLMNDEGEAIEKDGKTLKWQGAKPIIDKARAEPKFFEYLKTRFYRMVSGDGVEELPEDPTGVETPGDDELVDEPAVPHASTDNEDLPL